MRNTQATRSALRSFRSMDKLVETGDTSAMFAKMIRHEEFGEGVVKSAEFLAVVAATDAYATASKTKKDFGDIHFYTPDTRYPRDYLLNKTESSPYSNLEPCLDVHFEPKIGRSLDSVRRSMGRAAGWLEEVAEDYPMVYGCTYAKLADVALRHFGFQDVIPEKDIVMSNTHRRRLGMVHAVYGLMNGAEDQPLEIACVAARTVHLAEQWRKYSV